MKELLYGEKDKGGERREMGSEEQKHRNEESRESWMKRAETRG